MRKISTLFLALNIIFGLLSSSVFAASVAKVSAYVGGFNFTTTQVFYSDSKLVVRGVISNVGNATISNVSKLDLTVSDKSGNTIAETTFEKDAQLSKLQLVPGATKAWVFEIDNPLQGDISQYRVDHKESFDSIQPYLDETGIHVFVNSKKIHAEAAPFIENGTALVPLRAISEELGADVGWDKQTHTVTILKNQMTRLPVFVVRQNKP